MSDGKVESRELGFQEGSSNKFWKIELQGSSHTVQYGRVGTTGQTQTKTFDSEAEAKKSYDKLVAEKLKKGYTDSGSSPTPAATSSAATTSPAPAATTAKASAKSSTAAAKSSTKKTASKEAPAAATTASPSQDVNTQVTRDMGLDPQDYFLASPRFRSKPQAVEPQPFDQAACVAKLAKLKTTMYGWKTLWDDLTLPEVMTREEAHFWLIAATKSRGRETTMKMFSEWMSKVTPTGQVTVEEVRTAIKEVQRGTPPFIGLALCHLLSMDEYLSLVLDSSIDKQGPNPESPNFIGLIEGFNLYYIPRLSDAERDSLKARIRKTWNVNFTPPHHYSPLPAEYYLAAGLGMQEEIHQVIESWEDHRFRPTPWLASYQHPYFLLFALDSPELVATQCRRLALPIRDERDLRSLLATTELEALDFVAERIEGETNKESCESLLKIFAQIRAPEVAPYMLALKLTCKTPAIARDWLDTNVANAVHGLVEIAGGRGKHADAAIDYFRGLKRRGFVSMIEAAIASGVSPECASRIRSEVIDYEEKVYEPHDDSSIPPAIAAELKTASALKSKKLPTWATGSELPPLIVGDKRLNDAQIAIVLQLLAASDLSQKQPLFALLREHVGGHIRDVFAWQLFQHWTVDGCVSKDKWAMTAIGHLGGDGCVMKLTPLIRIWPGESQHARAVLGLECLRAIGSSTALMQLSSIAQKLKFKGLQTKAQVFVDEIALERGLTRDELEDRVVPDCGLDENGRREFSYGARSFSFVLDSDLKAMVRDEAGKLRPNLPDPNSKDDAALAEASLAEWKLLKKQVKEVATIQAGRLEQAMVTGRRWSVGDFQTLLVQHPLMTHLVQKMIWAGFASDGSRRLTFRVTEERDLADSNDDTTKLDGCETIGIVHPLELSEAERACWGQVIGDYELVAPFPQLGRAVYGLEKGEETSLELSRFNGMKLVAPTLVFTLEKLGWIRGTAMDAGCFDEHSKQFPSANVTAVINYEGTVGMGYIDPNEMLTIERVTFFSRLRKPGGYGWDSEQKAMLGSVSPIVLSEVIADLQVLKSKAK